MVATFGGLATFRGSLLSGLSEAIIFFSVTFSRGGSRLSEVVLRM